ncbi:NAD(P)-dependent oxidoreductase [Blastomonas marina]|uniref:NAD-dependent epimerase/dehydratase family protein n=1 Tax=Blastomonas marina TaxID=1867408 RepID=UPI002AC8A775|nr:NAD(P)-dependent oxidoreductase [Blastomonas marina]WPZ02773.1 NAD(P)-dependent oxidoreductase [Blastomonas marina]
MVADLSVLAITGGTGFVGRATIERALAAGHTVRALTRRPQSEREGLEWIAGDLSDDTSLERLVADSDAVIHVAGVVSASDPALFEAANVRGAYSLARAAEQAGPERLVLVSSLAAREPDLSLYGRSKKRGEDVVRASGLDCSIVRPPAVYGPHDTEMFELFRAAKKRVLPMPPQGRTSVIHVDDLASLLLTLAGQRGDDRIYEPDDGRAQGWEHGELARAIAAAVGRKAFVPRVPGRLLSLAARGDRMLRGDKAKLTPDRVGYMVHPDWVARPDRRPPPELWQPQIDTYEGLAATARWYEAQGWL